MVHGLNDVTVTDSDYGSLATQVAYLVLFRLIRLSYRVVYDRERRPVYGSLYLRFEGASSFLFNGYDVHGWVSYHVELN